MDEELLHACRHDDVGSVRSILAKGHDPDATNDDLEWSGLHIAASRGNWELASVLLDHSADINLETLDTMTALTIATKHGHTEFVVQLLGWPSVDIHHDNFSGLQAIHYASEAGNLQLLELIVASGADIDAMANDGSTPLMFAVQGGSRDCVSFLLDKNANRKLTKDNQWGVLHVAAFNRAHDILNCILQGHPDEVNSANKDGDTALHLAVSSGYMRTVELLLDANANVECKNRQGWSPLHMACHSGYTELAKVLLQRQADIESPTNAFHTPLYLACQAGNNDCVSLLITHNASVNTTGKHAMTPLHAATCFHHVRALGLLVEAGAAVDAQTRSGSTPLLLAVQTDNKESVNMLLKSNARTNLSKFDGWTPLHAAVSLPRNTASTVTGQQNNQGSCSEMSALLIKYGANPNTMTVQGKTPLLIVCESGCVACLQILLDVGGDTQQPDKRGWLPLHAAAHAGHQPIIELLLARHKESDLEATTFNGSTALTLARNGGHTECVRSLLSYNGGFGLPQIIKPHRPSDEEVRLSSEPCRIVSCALITRCTWIGQMRYQIRVCILS